MPDKDLSAWWKNSIFYHIYPQSFKDSNNDGIGDLQGIIQKLDYLQHLQIDAIWLSPVYPSPLIDQGYDISDYRSIHPHYGTKNDFMQLLQEAHKREIRVIIDMVFNHTSDQHPWFLESCSSVNNPKRDWYLWHPPRKGKKPNNWRTNFGRKAWRYDETTGEFYHHSFFWQQPDLNWRNTEVKQEMMDIISYWLDKGVDGFRLDVINFLFKDKEFRNLPFFHFFSNKHTLNRNQSEIYDFLKEFRALLDKYSDKISIGEIYMTPPCNSELSASFLGNGTDMLHLAFDFSLIFTIWKASEYYKAISTYYRHLPQGGWPCFFLSNHDIGRCVKKGHSAFYKYSKAKLHAILILTLKGTPFIYYGDEIGMENADIPKHKIRDVYGKMLYPFYKGRDKARTPMQWDNTAYAGFSMVEPWLPVNENYLSVNVKFESSNENSVYATYKKMIELRKQYPVLQLGEIKFQNKGNGNILMYNRYLQNEKIIVLLNFENSRKSIIVEDTYHASVLFSTHRKYGSIMKEIILLEPYEGLVLKKE